MGPDSSTAPACARWAMLAVAEPLLGTVTGTPMFFVPVGLLCSAAAELLGGKRGGERLWRMAGSVVEVVAGALCGGLAELKVSWAGQALRVKAGGSGGHEETWHGGHEAMKLNWDNVLLGHWGAIAGGRAGLAPTCFPVPEG